MRNPKVTLAELKTLVAGMPFAWRDDGKLVWRPSAEVIDWAQKLCALVDEHTFRTNLRPLEDNAWQASVVDALADGIGDTVEARTDGSPFLFQAGVGISLTPNAVDLLSKNMRWGDGRDLKQRLRDLLLSVAKALR